MRVLILVPLALSLGGCIAQTAASIVTLPVKVVSKTADVLTTSQSEADEKRGRAIRKQEEREAKARRKAEREERRRVERDD
jgi:predicted Holliday junction resolvase-like endonuclease